MKYVFLVLLLNCEFSWGAPLKTAATPTPSPTAAPTPNPNSYTSMELKPVDEASQDPSFLKFRTNLLEILEKKDLTELKKIIEPNIKSSFGMDGDSDEGFYRGKKLDKNPEKSLFWDEFKSLLVRGGRFTKTPMCKNMQCSDTVEHKSFQGPYYSSNWPDGYEPYDYVVILEKDVPVFEKSDSKSTEIAKLSHQIVKADHSYTSEWRKIQLPSGSSGFVVNSMVGSPIGQRFNFVLIKKEWKLNTYVGGD